MYETRLSKHFYMVEKVEQEYILLNFFNNEWHISYKDEERVRNMHMSQKKPVVYALQDALKGTVTPSPP